MSQEKLHKMVLSQSNAKQKVRWLKFWNFGRERKEVEGFPLRSMNNPKLESFLHKATYWWHVQMFYLCYLLYLYVFVTIGFDAHVACVILIFVLDDKGYK